MKRAFTLVELLVVISIMAILTVVTVSQFRTAKKRANDVARKGDLNAVAKALQLYFADYGTMPEALDGKIKTGAIPINWGEEFIDAAPTPYTYMVKLPTENTTGDWPQYCYKTTGNKYALFAKLEVESDKECDRDGDGNGNFTYVCGLDTDYCYANVSPNANLDSDGNFIP